MTDRELMRMALDALEKRVLEYETVEALRARLAQPEREPPCKTGSQCVGGKCERCAVQEWQGLTDEEVWEMDAYKMAITDQEMRWLYRFARAIEAKLKEKNT